MVSQAQEHVTELLGKWRAGDQQALDALVPSIYAQLRAIAHNYLNRERCDHTLQSAALVHEAYLRLVGGTPISADSRGHFVALAAKLMREILVDYARGHQAAKRGAGLKVELTDSLDAVTTNPNEIIAVNDALNELATQDEQQSKIVEMRCFGGLTIAETAEALGISPATVKRDWNMAKAWLTRYMQKSAHGETRKVEQS